MNSPADPQTIQSIIYVLLGLYFAYTLFKKPSHSDPRVLALEEKRRDQILWVAYAIPAIIIVAFPVFIFLYPNEMDLIGERVQKVVLSSMKILIIPWILININFLRKKKRLLKEIKERKQDG